MAADECRNGLRFKGPGSWTVAGTGRPYRDEGVLLQVGLTRLPFSCLVKGLQPQKFLGDQLRKASPSPAMINQQVLKEVIQQIDVFPPQCNRVGNPRVEVAQLERPNFRRQRAHPGVRGDGQRFVLSTIECPSLQPHPWCDLDFWM
jgi:hypothetical protein